MIRPKQHVVPNSNGSWGVRRHGAVRASRVFGSRDDAMRYARDVARKEGSDLYLHNADGSVRQREIYEPKSARPQRTR